MMAFWFLPMASALMVVQSLSVEAESRLRRSFVPAALLWAVVTATSLLQIPFPAVYEVLHRDAGLIADGQLWRLVTSPLVQGGAVMGAVPNLVGLAFLSLVAMAYWGPARTWLVFWGGAIASNIAVLGIHPVGGGNSMANFAIATALTSSVLLDRRRRKGAWGFAVVGLLCVAVFVAWGNYHLWSCLIGLLVGLLPVLRCQPLGPLGAPSVERQSLVGVPALPPAVAPTQRSNN